MSEIVCFSRDEETFAQADAAFRTLCVELADLLPYASIEHIGSTSVPDSLTKGDLDIGVGTDPELLESSANILEKRFDRNLESDRTPEFCAFKSAHEPIEVGIQLYAKGSIFERRFIEWRDALLHDPELLVSYNGLKARFEGKLMQDYRAAKSKFIRDYLRDEA